MGNLEEMEVSVHNDILIHFMGKKAAHQEFGNLQILAGILGWQPAENRNKRCDDVFGVQV